jgi:hypothetical protein
VGRAIKTVEIELRIRERGRGSHPGSNIRPRRRKEAWAILKRNHGRVSKENREGLASREERWRVRSKIRSSRESRGLRRLPDSD